LEKLLAVMRNIKALIIDDEFQSRNLLSKLLAVSAPDVQLVGQASSVQEAFISIEDLQPDLIFLDVMLNEATGFDLLKKFSEIKFEVIFTTAHNEFALKAFRFNAIDYLLKPIDPDELDLAIKKAKEKLHLKQFTSPEHLENLYQSIRNPGMLPKKIAIPTSQGFLLQPVDEIIYCQSVGNYTQFFFTQKRKLLSSYTLKQYDEILSEYNFFRAHRSFLINLDHVQQYQKGEGGTVSMSDGSEIEISRRNKEAFIQLFKKQVS
jgi:two-component system LytT family response regulator